MLKRCKISSQSTTVASVDMKKKIFVLRVGCVRACVVLVWLRHLNVLRIIVTPVARPLDVALKKSRNE